MPSWNDAIADAITAAFAEQEEMCLLVTAGVEHRSPADALEASHGDAAVRRANVTAGSLVGIGAGAARAGTRVVVEMPTDSSIAQTVGHLSDHVTTAQYYSAGRVTMPLLIRGVVGHEGAAADELSLASLPGLTVVIPSSPRVAAGLARTALQASGPVLLLEPSQLLSSQSDPTPHDEELCPLGKAALLLEGGDVTLVALGANVDAALAAATLVQAEGIGVDLIDIRTLAPLDMATVMQSVRKTGRVFIADMSGSVGGWGAELAARLADVAFDCLDAPILRRSGSVSLEHPGIDPQRLAEALREIVLDQ
ncbi:MAG: hypothetical protein KDB14_16845 [Planctomycetales bacterium]|nr:hypothetical protein [Planctomycetales bacterium]